MRCANVTPLAPPLGAFAGGRSFFGFGFGDGFGGGFGLGFAARFTPRRGEYSSLSLSSPRRLRLLNMDGD